MITYWTAGRARPWTVKVLGRTLRDRIGRVRWFSSPAAAKAAAALRHKLFHVKQAH